MALSVAVTIPCIRTVPNASPFGERHALGVRTFLSPHHQASGTLNAAFKEQKSGGDGFFEVDDAGTGFAIHQLLSASDFIN